MITHRQVVTAGLALTLALAPLTPVRAEDDFTEGMNTYHSGGSRPESYSGAVGYDHAQHEEQQYEREKNSVWQPTPTPAPLYTPAPAPTTSSYGTTGSGAGTGSGALTGGTATRQPPQGLTGGAAHREESHTPSVSAHRSKPVRQVHTHPARQVCNGPFCGPVAGAVLPPLIFGILARQITRRWR